MAETETTYTHLTIPERIEMVNRTIHQTEANICAAELDLSANRAVIAVLPKGLQDATTKDLNTLAIKLLVLRTARGVYASTLAKLEALNVVAAARLSAEQELAARVEAEKEAAKLLDFVEARERLAELRGDNSSPTEE